MENRILKELAMQMNNMKISSPVRSNQNIDDNKENILEGQNFLKEKTDDNSTNAENQIIQDIINKNSNDLNRTKCDDIEKYEDTSTSEINSSNQSNYYFDPEEELKSNSSHSNYKDTEGKLIIDGQENNRSSQDIDDYESANETFNLQIDDKDEDKIFDEKLNETKDNTLENIPKVNKTFNDLIEFDKSVITNISLGNENNFNLTLDCIPKNVQNTDINNDIPTDKLIDLTYIPSNTDDIFHNITNPDETVVIDTKEVSLSDTKEKKSLNETVVVSKESLVKCEDNEESSSNLINITGDCETINITDSEEINPSSTYSFNSITINDSQGLDESEIVEKSTIILISDNSHENSLESSTATEIINPLINSKVEQDHIETDFESSDTTEINNPLINSNVTQDNIEPEENPENFEEKQEDTSDINNKSSSAFIVLTPPKQVEETAKMTELEEKLQQENSELKLELNAAKQAIATLELEIGKKDEVILKKEQQMQQDIKSLKEELKEKSTLIEKDLVKNLEEALKEAKARETQALSDLNDRINSELNYRKIVEEFESAATSAVSSSQKLKEENKTLNKHLTNLEMSFSDLHQKYERTKTVIKDFKTNEEALKNQTSVLESSLRKYEDRYESLKAYAESQIEKCNKVILQTKEEYETNITKKNAIIKRLEIKILSLETLLEQKSKECSALSALCEEVTGNSV